MIGKCKLCDNERQLLQSHIIPKFVFKWMKETGGNYFMECSKPGIRLQDGHKEKLFCKKCEQIFSLSEKWFAEYIFRPYLYDNLKILSYNNQLCKFVISILWRVLLPIIKKNDSADYKFKEKLYAASAEWREFLLNDEKPKIFDEIHLCLMPDEYGEVQSNDFISRYFTRVVHCEVLMLQDECFIYAKFSKFLFFGDISLKKDSFRNAKINFSSGFINTRQYIDNHNIVNYLNNTAKSLSLVSGNLTQKQQDRIVQEFRDNYEKYINSDMGKRITQDISAKIDPNAFFYSFNYICNCCDKEIREPEGYLLRTFEIIKSQKYWDKVFKEMQYGKDEEGLIMRIKCFRSVTSETGPWVICDECSQMFDFDKKENKNNMVNWISSKGRFLPPKVNDFMDHISEKEMRQISHWFASI